MRRQALAAVAGTVTLLTLGMASDAQEKDAAKNKEAAVAPAPEKERFTLRNVARLGYTRPGFPEDKLNADGSIRPAALDPDSKDKLIGGTFYFLVLERTGDDGDTWGTGMANFNESFVEGKNFKNKFSPALDTQAKFLYLYQIVNDRGLDPPFGGVKAAAGQPINVVPIAGSVLKIIVDPRYITSWGHFKGTGFKVRVPDRDRKGDIRLAADKSPAEIQLAVSSNPSILAGIPNKRYLSPAPAHSLKGLRGSFGLGPSTLNLKTSSAYAELLNKKANKAVALAAYEENMLRDAENAKEPEYVQLVYSGFEQDNALNDKEIDAQFRVDWRRKDLMDLGFHSVVFGFTSDLPPKDERVRIFDKDTALKAMGLIARNNNRRVLPDLGFVFQQDDEQFVQQGGGAAPGIAPAVGTAPTPGGAPGAAGFGSSPVGSLGGGPAGFPMGGGMGGGGFGGGGLGRFGGIPGTGSGGGFGAGAGTGNAAQQQKQQGGINVNISLKNQQQQSQQQQQQQQQQQSQTPPTGVVPEPGTIILALLGLPGLYFLCRLLRRTGRLVA